MTLGEAINEVIKNIPKTMEKIINENYPKNYLIGSGSNFTMYENITYTKAKKIFENLPQRQSNGKCILNQSYCGFKIQKYNTLESMSGYTYYIMIPVEKIIGC